MKRRIREVDAPDVPLPARPGGQATIAQVGTAAAVANAVYHAIGIRIRELPIRIEKLLDA